MLNEVERLATLRNAEVIVAAMQAELPAREVHYLVAPQFSKRGAPQVDGLIVRIPN